MENLEIEIENFVTSKADLAIKISETYKEALDKIRHFSGLTPHCHAIKKAIQDEIISRALNGKIN